MYWENLNTGEKTWQNPFKFASLKPEVPAKRDPHAKGTWSGSPGGNPLWTPVYTRNALGSKVSVFNAYRDPRTLANCGGQTGECDGWVPGNGAGPAGEKDAFNPGSPMISPALRGDQGSWWDAHRAGKENGGKAGAEAGERARGGQRSLKDEYGGLRTSQLAEIYGVKISDDDAYR